MPHIKTYPVTELNQLLHDVSFNIVKRSDGLYFFSNLAGLGYFDGKVWDIVQVPNVSVFSVHYSEFDGNVYAGGDFVFGYIAPDQSGRYEFEFIDLTESAPDEILSQLDAIWEIKDCEKFIYLRMDTAVLVYEKETAEFTQIVNFESRVLPFWITDGVIHAISRRELYAFDGSRFNEADTSSEVFERGFTMNTVLSDGRTVYCRHDRCFIDDDNSGNGIIDIEGQFGELAEDFSLTSLVSLPDNTLVVSTITNGLIHFTTDGEILATYNRNLGLPDNTVYGLYKDDSGLLWGTSEKGIFAIDLLIPMRKFGPLYGIEGFVSEVTYFDGALYFLQVDGVRRKNADGTLDYVLPVANCAFLRKIDSQLMLICYEEDIWSLDSSESQFQRQPYAKGVNAVFDRNSGRMLTVSIRDGMLYEYEANDDSIYALKQSQPLNAGVSFIPELETDKNGNIWFSTATSGIGFIEISRDENGIIVDAESSFFYDEVVRDVATGTEQNSSSISVLDGEVLFSTNDSKIRTLDENFELTEDERFNFVEGEEALYILYNLNYIQRSPNGRLWAGNSDFRLTAMDYNSESNRFEARNTGAEFYSRNRITSLEASPYSFIQDGIDRVFVGTNDGLMVWTDYPDNSINTSLKSRISRVLLNNEEVLSYGYNNNGFTIPYDRNELRFDYATMFFSGNTRINHRVKLEGYDQDWSSWSGEADSKFYTSLREGNYRFLVQSTNDFNEIYEAKAFAFRVLPPWYRAWWAYMLYAITISGFLYASYRYRLNQLLKEHTIRNRIASDLHDEVSATLSSISYFAQAVELRNDETERKRFINLISESAGDAKEKISDIVWAINPEHDDWKTFFSRCRRFAIDLFESRQIEATIDIQSSLRGKLDMYRRQHLWMIFKEMLINVARHSQATKATVLFTYENEHIRLRVSDNGKGIDEKTITFGNGLNNIKKRAAELKAKVSIESKVGEGTTWDLRLKL
ncbi:MAG: histidine kinase [Balneolales bacterium]|nr:histidine kinase [Balneolales bacterium]